MQAKAYLGVKLCNNFQSDLSINCRLLLLNQRMLMQLLKYLLLIHVNCVYEGVLVIEDGKIEENPWFFSFVFFLQ